MPSPPPSPPPPPVDPDAVYQETEDDTFVYATDWKEAIGDNQVGGGVTMSADGQESIRVGFVRANKKRSCARYFLGFSFTGVDIEGSGEFYLHRYPPARDPEFPQLRCYAVAIQDLAPKGDQPHPLSEDEEYIGEHPEAAALQCTKKMSPFYGADGEDMWFAQYEWCMVTLSFKSFGRVRFAAAGQEYTYLTEWRRFCDIRTEPQLETLSVSGMGSGLKYAETPDSLTGEDPNGKPYPADTYEYMPMEVVTVRWLFVPHDYISDDANGLSCPKINACVGRVNEFEMFDAHPAGTLLMLPPKYEPCLFPVAPAGAATTADDTDLVGGWNVTFTFKKFDPPRGKAASIYRGHNLYPWRGRGATGGAELGKWLYCTRNGDVAGPPFIPVADMRKIFQHVSDPA